MLVIVIILNYFVIIILKMCVILHKYLCNVNVTKDKSEFNFINTGQFLAKIFCDHLKKFKLSIISVFYKESKKIKLEFILFKFIYLKYRYF